MKQILSKAEPGTLLHVLYRAEDFGTKERIRLSPSSETLMCAAISMEPGKAFRPHQHLPQYRQTSLTQEVWVIVGGIVDVTYYDLDGQLLCKARLHKGDCTITLRGGHAYEARSEQAKVYEIKTGPYHGRELDKRYIDNEG